MTDNIILSLHNIKKKFPGVLALDNVSIDFREGEVHCICGENGAGKSTLIKIISGALQPDEGEIRITNKKYNALTAKISRELGIETIYQEFNLVPALSVAENIYLGKEVKKSGLFDKKTIVADTRKVLDLIHADIDPAKQVNELTVAYKQLVEIAKAISKNTKILIMDEPTAPLSTTEVETLFELISKLKKQGTTIIYISHRLNELFRVGDRCSVMRDGKMIITTKTSEISRAELIKNMVGREIKEDFRKREHDFGDVVLELKHLYGEGIHDISLSVRKGEILGLAGLIGAGRTEAMRLAYGADVLYAGQIFVEGKEVKDMTTKKAVTMGIGLVPEERKLQGIDLEQSIKWNISLPILKKISRGSVVNTKTETMIAEREGKKLKVKTPSYDQIVCNLSGGNQQKVVLAKWLASECKVLIMDEPTRGIDIGAKQEIYKLMNELSARGIAIIMISSEMEEILGMTDRLVVFHEGKLISELQRNEYCQETVLMYASGI